METTLPYISEQESDIALLEEKRKRFYTKTSAIANAFGVNSELVLSMFATAQYKTWLHCRKFLPKEENNATDNPLTDLLIWDIVREKLKNRQLSTKALTDELTGIFNRRAFDLALKRRVKNFARQGYGNHANAFSLIIFDLDNFKKINDNFGHPVGDAVLKEVSQTVRNQLRPTDFLARFGGEEFVIIVEGNSKSAFDLAERVRETITMIQVERMGINPNTCSMITASFGVSEYIPLNNDLETAIQLLISRTDKALYNAKERGRNRTAMKNH
ncbi:MAG: GGDEF domain-containing protein [Candidatus Pacebacteria bacterium]|nr:GGDEF domain-containing protein [Candidatus Paceibacterota bacterium]